MKNSIEHGMVIGENEELKKTELENQFDNPLDVETEDGILKIYEVNPKEKVDTTPILVSPGFTQGANTLKRTVLAMGNAGRHTVLPDLPHGNPSSVRDELWNESEYEMGKAATHLKTLEVKEIEKTDAVGHSEGCINLVFAAATHPEKFRNLILVNPGGLIGKDNIIASFVRFGKNLKTASEQAKASDSIRKTKATGQKERDSNFTADIGKSYDSARSITSTQLEELLAVVKSNGIGISIIHTKDDKVFPIDRVRKMNERYRKGLYLEDLPEEDTHAELIDNFYEIDGEHNDFYLKPEEYADIISNALGDMKSDKVEK